MASDRGRPLVSHADSGRSGEPLRAALNTALSKLGVRRKLVAQALKPGATDWLARAGGGLHPMSEADFELLLSYEAFTETQRLDLRFAYIQSQINFAKQPRVENKVDPRFVGFITATNHDIIFGQSCYAHLGRSLPAFSDYPELILRSEQHMIDELNRVLAEFETKVGQRSPGQMPFQHAYGGSGFIAASYAAIAGCVPGVVAVAGSAHPNLVEQTKHHKFAARARRIDDLYLEGTNGLGGHTLAVATVHGENLTRQLATLPAGNTDLYRHLVANFWPIVHYLARGRILHLTSLFDDKSPAVLASIVGEARRINPKIIISFDPGDHWTKLKVLDGKTRTAVEQILLQTRLLFVSESELDNLAMSANPHVGQTDAGRAEQVVSLLDASDGTIVVVKRTGDYDLYDRQGVIAHPEPASPPLLLSEIEDDTGAGDAFAAGVISGLINGEPIQEAANLGLTFARLKLRVVGHPSAEDISRAFWEKRGDR